MSTNITDTTTSALPENVIDINTKRSVLPDKVRRIIRSQYYVSKDCGDTPEKFLQELETRLLGELAYATVNTVREFFNSYEVEL